MAAGCHCCALHTLDTSSHHTTDISWETEITHTQRAGPHQNLTVAIMLTVADAKKKSKKNDVSWETEITHTHTKGRASSEPDSCNNADSC